MNKVIIESPYAGDIEGNVAYARKAVRDSVLRGEAPIASHLLFTQPGILRDEIPEERKLGIEAGLAWRTVANFTAFYVDRGWSEGMKNALRRAYDEGKVFYIRAFFEHQAEVSYQNVSDIVPKALYLRQCSQYALN